MMRRSLVTASAIVAATLLAGCGGGGGQHTALPASPAGTVAGPSSSVAPANVAPLTISVKIPSRTPASAKQRALLSTKRLPAYVSAGTLSMQAYTLPSGTDAAFVNCTSGATCTLALGPPATDTSIVVTLYASPGGAGTALATQTMAIALTAGVPSTVTMTLDGITDQMALSGAPASIAVNYASSFTLTTIFPDPSANDIGTIGNVIDSSGNVILGGGGAPINIAYTYTDASLTSPAPTFAAGPPYSLSQLVSYSGAAPTVYTTTTTPINPSFYVPVSAVQTGGLGIGSNVINVQVLPPLSFSTADTTYLLSGPPAPTASPTFTLEFPSLSPVTANLTVTANIAALPTTLTLGADTCTSGSWIDATLSSGSPYSFTGSTVALTLTTTAATNGSCSFTLTDNAGAPGPNSITATLNFTNGQIFIQGKKRK